MSVERCYVRRVSCCIKCPNLAFVEYEKNSYCYANGKCTNIDNKIVKTGKLPTTCPLPKMTDTLQINAEMYAVLKVCKGIFEEMGVYEDSVTYKMICATLEAAKEEGEK